MGLIRLLLALSVIANHCGSFINNDLVGGVVAVQTFYIISGFYMSLVLNEKYINQNSSYKLFISNRLMKLMPLYWVVFVIVVVTSLVITNWFTYDTYYFNFHHYRVESPNITSYLFLFFSNVFIVGQDIAMFMCFDQRTGEMFFTENFRNVDFATNNFLLIPQAWSLSIEITFYLVAPFILKKGLRPVSVLFITSLLLRLFLYNDVDLKHDPWTYRFFPTELLFFLLGYISYQWYKRVRTYNLNTNFGYVMIVIIVLLTLGFYKIPFSKLSFSPFSLRELLYFVTLTFTIPFVFNATRRSKIDRILGDLSFPVYIVHYFVYCILITFFEWGHIPEFLKSSFTVAIISISLSYFLNKFLMDPLETKRQARLS